MGPLAVSPEAFTREEEEEEEEECLLNGECGGHRREGDARNRPSSSRTPQGCGAWEDTGQFEGMLEAGCV